MSNDTTPTPLYSDERIHKDLANCHTPRKYYKDSQQYIEVLQAEALMMQMRDLFEARIAELEAADEWNGWEPIDFAIDHDGWEVQVDDIAVTIGRGDTAMFTVVWPSDGEYAICRRVAGGGDSEEASNVN